MTLTIKFWLKPGKTCVNFHFNNCIKLSGREGCVGSPGASTVTSWSLDSNMLP